jgi:lysyl-tRNA synthetase class 2
VRSWGAATASGLLVAAALTILAPGRLLGGDPPALDRIALAALLVLLARGVAGRRRLARQVALGLVTIAVVVPPVHFARLAALAAVAALLLAYPSRYVVRPDPQRLRAAFAAAVVAVGFVLARGLWEAARHDEPVRQAAHLALPLLPEAPDRSTRVFVVTVFAAVLVALALAMAPAVAPPPGDEHERARVRALVQHPDSGSLAPFATRADKTYVFSPDGDAVIGYRVRFGVALAGGDPVGAAGSAEAAVTAFAELCAVRGWRPAVLGAASATGDVWRRAGVRRAVEIGDEAVLDVATFSLATRRMRNVRQAVQRARNTGVQVRIGALEPALVPRLVPILRDWLHGRAERGFAMNLDRILMPRDDVVVAVAYDGAGEPQAFARFALVAGGRALSLDVAPRGRTAPNGVVERLIVEAVGYAREHGAREVSLNFAGMRRVYAGQTPAAELLQMPLKALDRWIELRTLYRFTDKFQPCWRPRQLRMRSWLDLVPVATAALTAEFGARPADVPATPELAEAPA